MHVPCFPRSLRVGTKLSWGTQKFYAGVWEHENISFPKETMTFHGLVKEGCTPPQRTINSCRASDLRSMSNVTLGTYGWHRNKTFSETLRKGWKKYHSTWVAQVSLQLSRSPGWPFISDPPTSTSRAGITGIASTRSYFTFYFAFVGQGDAFPAPHQPHPQPLIASSAGFLVSFLFCQIHVYCLLNIFP